MKKKTIKTIFRSKVLKSLHKCKDSKYHKIQSVINGDKNLVVITQLPAFVSNDSKIRPLILRKYIVNKIQKDHGGIIINNLILNALNWEYVIKNVDKNRDKINLIKMIPGSNDLLLIGANRKNGFFIVTHYEIHAKNSNKLKSLLQNRGNSLDSTGGAALPHLQLSHNETASWPDLPSVSGLTDIIIKDD